MSQKIQKRISLFLFLLGLALLILLMQRLGMHDVLTAIRGLGFKMIYILIFPITWYIIQSFAWWRVLSDDGGAVSFGHVLLTKITGEAINTVTPASFLGGDPFRIYLLQTKTSKTNSAASVVIDRTMYMLGVCLLLLVTLLIAWIELPLPGLWQVFFPVFTLLFFFAFVLLVFFQRRGMFGTISRWSQRLGIKREKLLGLESRIDNLDRLIGGFYQKNKGQFFEIMMLQFIGRLFGAVEIFLIANLMSLPISFVHCLFLASLTVLINMVFVFIPGSMGVMESGYGALFYLLHLNPVIGVIIQLIRRIRAFFWIGIGLVIILVYRPVKSNHL